MANKKFSQFDVRTNPANIDALVGYEGLDNIQIDPADLIPEAKIMVTGSFQNLFGGSPGIFGDTLEFGISAVPASNNSSVLSIPFDCTITDASVKWISSTAVNITGTDTWQVKLYKMNNASGSTSVVNYTNTPIDFTGIVLTVADNNTFPAKFATGLNIDLNAGDIINVSGVESGTIGTSDGEMEMTIAMVPR